MISLFSHQIINNYSCEYVLILLSSEIEYLWGLSVIQKNKQSQEN